MTYSAEHTAQAEAYPTLGAEYFVARDAAEKFLAHWQEEHAAKVAEEVIKPILDTIHERVNDAFRDYLISDAEQNLQSEMRGMVERTVNALLGGSKWANLKYLETPYGDGKAIREALAKLHSNTIKDGRIADLEAEVGRLKKDLEFHRNRY